jgi:hypothetical protein
MRKTILLMMLPALVLFAALALRPSFTLAQQQEQPNAPRAADAKPQPFNPQLASLMNMLIQPRHEKLWLAGKAENWDLAAYALQELKLGFGVISRAVPRWKGLPVPDLIQVAVAPSFTMLDFAIKAGEPHQFKQSFEKLTQGCNNCHTTADHAFIVIKVPDASSFPNQEFKPAGR